MCRVTERDESIELSWTPRPAELADAQLARTRDLGGSSIRSVVAVVLAALGASMLPSPLTLPVAGMLYALAFLLVWMRVTTSIMRRRWALMIAGNPALADTVEAKFDANGARTEGERLSMVRRWSAFTSWSDTPDAVVFATSDNANAAVLVVPHRAASGPAELAALRALAERQLGPALGSGPVRPGRRWWPWLARAVVVALLVIPVAVTMNKVHGETGEWRLWPSESPALLSYDGADFQRVGGPTSRPERAVGAGYTPGGGLIMKQYSFPDEKLTELWVLDHDNVIRRYVATGPSDDT
jgi:hypothetical protein